MDERHLALLQQISDSLDTIAGTIDEVNRGIAMLIDKTPENAIVDKLDDIAGGVGDINSKMGGSAQLHDALASIQQALNDLPAEISAGVTR